jgi:hypothetical protein
MTTRSNKANEALVKKLATTKDVLEKLEKPKSFADAMLLAQSVMPNKIEGSGNNPHFNSDHITFDQLVLVATTILHELGLRFKQKAHVLENNDVGIETIICGYGEEESYGIVPIKASTSSPHASAGNVTYAKRYSLALALNISHGKDDDGLLAEIETRQKQVADKAAPVEGAEGDFKLFSGDTCIASYIDVFSFLEGCRKLIGKPKDLTCKAIFDSSIGEVEKAIVFAKEHPDVPNMTEAQHALAKMMAMYK